MLDVLVSGLANGAVYALVAIGFSLVHRTTGVLNFAQGAFVMVGGLGAFGAMTRLDLPYPLALLAGLALAGLVAVVIWSAVVVPLKTGGAPGYVLILATLVAAVALTLGAQYALGSEPQTLPPLLRGLDLEVAGRAVNPQQALVIVVGACLAALFGLLVKRSSLGRQMRACAADASTAALLGISYRRVGLWAFVITGLIGGIGGQLIAAAQYTSFDAGVVYGIYGFIAAMIGGLGSLVGALAGGLVVGLLYALVAAYVSSTYATVFVFMLLLATLWLRPHGLVPGRE